MRWCRRGRVAVQQALVAVYLCGLLATIATAAAAAASDAPPSPPPLWVSRNYSVHCCQGGWPEHETPQKVRNFTVQASDYEILEENAEDDRRIFDSPLRCRLFEGGYLLMAATFVRHGVVCNCSTALSKAQTPLDAFCRPLVPCQNNGFHSFELGLRCACPPPFFGDRCERVCENGQLIAGLDGRHDYCSCEPFFQGDECRQVVCLNGGVERQGRCACAPRFLGNHCELDANATAALVHQQQSHRFNRYDPDQQQLFSRDVSGTVFSLAMIAILVVSMYLLMKHRMQSGQSRERSSDYAATAATSSSTNSRHHGRRSQQQQQRIHTTVSSAEFLDRFPQHRFVVAAMEGPPPYLGEAARQTNERLPPLPSYEDATKCAPFFMGTQVQTTQSSQQQATTPEMGFAGADVPSSSSSSATPILRLPDAQEGEENTAVNSSAVTAANVVPLQDDEKPLERRRRSL